MFSPTYARERRRRASVDPLEFPALNVMLRGRDGQAWVMSEHPAQRVERGSEQLVIGSSEVSWQGDGFVCRIDERTTPWPGALRGTIRVYPEAFNRRAFALDEFDRHRWWPIAPVARVEVELDEPAQRWSGHGYLDSNWGDEPLENAFAGWSWSRSTLDDQVAVHYVTDALDGTRRALALDFDRGGDGRNRQVGDIYPLPKTGWGISREVMADPDSTPRVVEELLDTPFYSRERVEHSVDGHRAIAMHEQLDLRRFSRHWVQGLLPFRTKRH